MILSAWHSLSCKFYFKHDQISIITVVVKCQVLGNLVMVPLNSSTDQNLLRHHFIVGQVARSHLAKLDQLFQAASFLTANVRYLRSTSSKPRGHGEPVRSQREGIPLLVRLCGDVDHRLCGRVLLCGGVLVPCAEEVERQPGFREKPGNLLEASCETPKGRNRL